MHCYVLQMSCIQGTPPYPLSCRTLQFFAISVIQFDHIGTYSAGAVVNFQRSGGSIVPAKVVVAAGVGAPCQALCQACPQCCQTSCQTSTKSAVIPAAQVAATIPPPPPPIRQPNSLKCSAELLGFWILPNCSASWGFQDFALQLILYLHLAWLCCIQGNTFFYVLRRTLRFSQFQVTPAML